MQTAMAMAVNMATSSVIMNAPSRATFSKNCTTSSSSSLSIPRRSTRVQSQPTNQEYVNYAGKSSVFPAEACDEVGGDACNVDGVGPEVKPKAAEAAPPAPKAETDGTNRVYVNYAGKKSVLAGEACDDLGGEFCEPEYQEGVGPEKK
jgi:hypothetical protein